MARTGKLCKQHNCVLGNYTTPSQWNKMNHTTLLTTELWTVPLMNSVLVTWILVWRSCTLNANALTLPIPEYIWTQHPSSPPGFQLPFPLKISLFLAPATRGRDCTSLLVLIEESKVSVRWNRTRNRKMPLAWQAATSHAEKDNTTEWDRLEFPSHSSKRTAYNNECVASEINDRTH